MCNFGFLKFNNFILIYSTTSSFKWPKNDVVDTAHAKRHFPKICCNYSSVSLILMQNLDQDGCEKLIKRYTFLIYSLIKSDKTQRQSKQQNIGIHNENFQHTNN